MNFGPHEIQMFVTGALMAGAIFAALACDHLRASNQQLREQIIELQVREEAEKPSVPEASPSAKSRALGAAAADSGKRPPAPEAMAAIRRGAEMATTPRSDAGTKAGRKPEPRKQSAVKEAV
jgi:hypothetical protein